MIAHQLVACALALCQGTDTLRTTNERIAEVLQFGLRSSATLRQLVAHVEAAGRVVYVAEGVCRHGAVRSCVQPIAGGRYLQILVDPRRPITAVVRQLAHELQHVAEIAESGAASAAEVRTLYERIGFPSCAPGDDCYETRRALAVESHVSREVTSGRVLRLNPGFFGTWRLNIAKSSFPTCPPSAGRRFDRDQGHGLASAVVEYVDCVGIGHRDAFVYKADGRQYAMVPGGDAHPSRAIAVTVVDTATLAFTVHAGNRIVACGRRALSADGTVMTIEMSTVSDGESPQRTFELWEKID